MDEWNKELSKKIVGWDFSGADKLPTIPFKSLGLLIIIFL